MERIIRKVYCGANQIVSSLGQSTSENYMGVESFRTNCVPFTDGTPVCRIEREKLRIEGLEDYTFAEQLSIIALREVIKKCGVMLNDPRTLLLISTTKGNIDCIKDDFNRSQLWALANELSEFFHCANKPLIVSNACVSGVTAAIVGARMIEREEYDQVYVLGVDVVSEFVVSGFNSFKSISPTVCKPYDISRDGLTLGEGCAVLLLTSCGELSESKIVVSGGGMSGDANHISGPSRTGDGLAFAMAAAMKDAGVEASDISLINTHGTGTPFNDEMESKALNIVSLTDVPCNSLKPYIGHTLGASGVIEIILAIEQLRHNHVFGVKGYAECGTPYELNVLGVHRDVELFHCLKTASGFGGTNAAIVLSKECSFKPKLIKIKKASIEQRGAVELRPSQMPFAEYIRSEYKFLADSNIKFFKMDDLSKLGYIASCKLFRGIELQSPSNRIGIVLANRNSSLDTDLNHQKSVDHHYVEGASPAVFVYTLANIVAAEIAIKHKLQGEAMMFVVEHKDMGYIGNYACQLIAENRCDAVVYGWCDLLGEEYNVELKLIKRI